MYRLFIAVPVPENIKSDLVSLRTNISGAKWADIDQLHITLKFLGEVEGQVFYAVREKLSEIKMEGFSLRFNGVGHFPPGNLRSGRTPRVLWAGLEDIGTLKKLRNRIESVLTEIGIDRDRRKFNPHVTLARLRSPNLKSATDFLSSHNSYKSENFPVREFMLYSSTLLPAGAVHTIEEIYPLK